MRFATGKVVDGKVVIEGPSLPEGTVVAIVSRGGEDAFTLSDDQERELTSAIAQIQRGDFVDADELLRSLRPGR